jgi:hypothetical protein
MDEAIKSDDEEFEGVIVIEDIVAAKFKTFIIGEAYSIIARA